MNATRLIQPRADAAESIRLRYRETRAVTLRLAAPLTGEDQMVQAAPETSPTKWHLAHTTWFFETFLLRPHARGYLPFDDRFPYLFNSYYKQLDGHPLRAIRGAFSRPSLQEVEDYRRYVDAAMDEFLQDAPAEQLGLAELGLQHEQQHQELIVTDIKYAFWMNPLRPVYRAATDETASAAPALNWHSFDGGICEVGAAENGFAFDNERPRHRVYLAPFQLASRLVTNAEYLEFMADGGYTRPELWLSDGWDHIRASGWDAPFYWEQSEGGWQVFTCDGMKALVPHEPVCHVSFYEADAYARWAKARLPTEADWEAAAGKAEMEGNFLESGRLHVSVAAHGHGLRQMFGDAWEWTASPYVGYPGYKPAAGALGEYNGKFMCNQMVLRGGSCVTPRSHIRATYRNFFPPQARWQFAGIRLAR